MNAPIALRNSYQKQAGSPNLQGTHCQVRTYHTFVEGDGSRSHPPPPNSVETRVSDTSTTAPGTGKKKYYFLNGRIDHLQKILRTNTLLTLTYSGTHFLHCWLESRRWKISPAPSELVGSRLNGTNEHYELAQVLQPIPENIENAATKP